MYVFGGYKVAGANTAVNQVIEKFGKATGPIIETSKRWQAIQIGFTIACKRLVTGVLNSQEIVIFGAILDKALILNAKTDCIKVVEDIDNN